MKTEQKMFPGLIVMIIYVIIMMAGCDISEDALFPDAFEGTWERKSSVWTNTLTITPDTLVDKGKYVYNWNLTNVYGNKYTMTINDTTNNNIPMTIIVVMRYDYDEGILHISGGSSSNEHDWSGQWENKK